MKGKKVIIDFLISCAVAFLLIFILIMSGCEEPKEETRAIKSCVLETDQVASSDGAFILGTGVFRSDSKITTEYYLYVMGREGFRL